MKIRKTIHNVYRAIQGVIAPKLKYAQYLYEDTLKSYVRLDTNRWLDLGCGRNLLPSWRSEEEKDLLNNCATVVGIDYDLKSLKDHDGINLKIRGDISNLPFKDNSFDLATANMVVEHLNDPEAQMKEVNRILRSGGVFIFHTPNVFSYSVIIGRLIPDIIKDKIAYILQGRKDEDIFETYYRANSGKRITCLAKKNGFEVLKTKMIVSSAIFAIIPPIAIIELVWIRILMTKLLRPFRTNIIAILKKQ